GVGRRNEYHLRQIEGHFDVMIAERIVLLRIKHFQQRSRRSTTEVHGHLVDLVKEDYRVVAAGIFDPLNDPAGHRPDVGSPVTANLRLVPNATKGQPYEFPSQRTGDGTGDGRFTYPWRANETKDRSLHLL